jgi:hypothetical protein
MIPALGASHLAMRLIPLLGRDLAGTRS